MDILFEMQGEIAELLMRKIGKRLKVLVNQHGGHYLVWRLLRRLLATPHGNRNSVHEVTGPFT